MRKEIFLFIVIFIFQCATQDSLYNDKYTQEVMQKGGPDEYFKTVTNDKLTKNLDYMDSKKDSLISEPYNPNNIEKIAKQQKCPLLIVEYEIKYNSINHPIAWIGFYNNSDKIIDALEVDMSCYNTWGEPVKYYSTGLNQYRGWAQNQNIYSNDSVHLEWNLVGLEQTAKIKNLKIYRLHFTDGTSWKR